MRRLTCILLLLGLACYAQAIPQEPKKPVLPPTQGTFVVHEWGTFLSVQGSDGQTIGGMVESEENLPKFVIQRGPDGWERTQARNLRVMFNKMETPVTYFYTDRHRIVTFKASMPKGLLTHWYPTVQEMTPAWKKDEQLATNAGSSINWGPFNVYPLSAYTSKHRTPALPAVAADNPWLSIRQPDSAIVSLSSGRAQPNLATETEKFLFYRGLGAFDLPLHVQSLGKDSALRLNLQNKSEQSLTGAFLIWVRGDQMRWAPIADLGGLSLHELEVEKFLGAAIPLSESVPLVKQAVSRALTNSGLYPKEANAMVDHWERDYFRSSGMRILYVLPREQTDAHIPIQVTPKPTEIVRTMVGRLEIITPDTELRLIQCLEQLQKGDAAQKAEAEKYLAGFGRMREAALRRVAQMNVNARIKALAEQLLSARAAWVVTNSTALVHDDKPATKIGMDVFLMDAMVAGLKADGVDRELAKKLAKQEENFVPKCGICGMVRKGLFFYSESKEQPASETPVKPEVVKKLSATDRDVRFAALKDLVQKYISAAMEKTPMTKEAKAQLQEDLERARKEAMGIMSKEQKYCPSCDGACKKTVW